MHFVPQLVCNCLMFGAEQLPAAMQEGEDATNAAKLQEAPSFGRDVQALTL